MSPVRRTWQTADASRIIASPFRSTPSIGCPSACVERSRSALCGWTIPRPQRSKIPQGIKETSYQKLDCAGLGLGEAVSVLQIVCPLNTHGRHECQFLLSKIVRGAKVASFVRHATVTRSTTVHRIRREGTTPSSSRVVRDVRACALGGLNSGPSRPLLVHSGCRSLVSLRVPA